MSDEIPQILVVDDDPFFRQVIIRILQKSESFKHADFVEAVDGLDAWEKVQDWRPTAVVLDVAMPRMDGHELATKLKEKYPDMPILILTGQPDPQKEQELKEEVKVESYLIKNVDHATLVDEVGRIIDIAPISLD